MSTSSGDQFILGISAYYHDSAAAVVKNGEIIAAASEERFSRIKGDSSFPARAVAYCLKEAGVNIHQLAGVGFYDKPILKFDRILTTYLSIAPRGFTQFKKSGPLWMAEKLWTEKNLRKELGGYTGELYFSEHHESHAASAFFPSPFEKAAVLTVDGVGEWTTSSQAIGEGSNLSILKELKWPNSLGLLYSAFAYYTGFKVNSGEYKVMGLAPYGEPKFVQTIYDELLDLKEDGSFTLNQDYFGYLDSLKMINQRFEKLFGAPPREPESELTQRDMDLARSVQDVCEDIMLRMANDIHRETGMKNLCLAGGVALNCVANGRISRETPFEGLWVQPAAGDAGGALGVALLVWHDVFNGTRTVSTGVDGMKGAQLGPEYSEREIELDLERAGGVFEKPSRKKLMSKVADLLAKNKVVGWFNGRMEYGPRALGNRSILGNPQSPGMQSLMNNKIKFREGFRPFAPSVLRERASEYFDLEADSPYMLIVAPIAESQKLKTSEKPSDSSPFDQLKIQRSKIPAVTHIDHSARIQTVDRSTNPDYYDLIENFEKVSGCAVLVNTSFNVRGEPIVCTPSDAFICFMRTNIDALVVGPYMLLKEDQDEWTDEEDWQWKYQLD